MDKSKINENVSKSKTFFVIGSLVCVGIGVLIGSLGVYYSRSCAGKTSMMIREAFTCLPREHPDFRPDISGIIKYRQVHTTYDGTIQHNFKYNLKGLANEKQGTHLHTYAITGCLMRHEEIYP